MSIAKWAYLVLGVAMMLVGTATIVREYRQWTKEIDQQCRRYDDWW